MTPQFLWSYLTHFSSVQHFYIPENVRKPLVFWCFQGVQKCNTGLNGLNNRTVSSDTHLETWLNVCSGVKKLSWTFGRFVSALLKSIFMYLYYQYQFFILRVPLSPRAPLRERVFCGNGSRISAADYFREKAQSWMFDQFLNTLLNSILMSLYYQYNYSFFINLFCYFIIPLL